MPATFIYAPGVKVYIQASRKNIGLVDVSDDLTDGTLVRRSDGVSTFNFTLNNPQRKYDSVFTPNDRIIVMMKRLAWVRVFTGLLNSVPLISAWPRQVPLSASCSLKRLQYWFWDPTASATQNMILDALSANQRAGMRTTDGGITNVVLTILKEVVGWPASKVHIAQIPDDWFKIARQVAEDIDAAAHESDVLAEQYRQQVGANGMIGGVPQGSASLPDGQYAGVTLSGDQCANAATIYQVCAQKGGSQRDAVLGIACAMQESTLHNLQGGDRDSVGLFQQRPSMGWGTVAQCTTPTYAAGKFYDALLQINSRTSMSESQAIQAVQRSAFPDAYQKWVSMAEAVVRVLSGTATSGRGPAGDLGSQSNFKTRVIGKAGPVTGQSFAQMGVNLVEKYPNIPYTRAYYGDNIANIAGEPPKGLDCSGFCQSIWYRCMGGLHGFPHKASLIDEWCRTHGGKRLTPKEAFATAGAFVFPADLSHIEITLGDGKTTVGTRTPGTPASTRVWSNINWYDHGYLVPGISYPDGIGSGLGVPVGDLDSPVAQAQTAPTLARDLPGYDPKDPFDKLFGDNFWHPQMAGQEAMSIGDAYTGIRALMNDQPLLQYLMNLMNSTMRSFCSAPNGDLIAWFPDYYGIWGTAAKMIVRPIELQDFTVDWSDDFFVTHQFTLAGQPGATFLDVSTGDIAEAGFARGVGADIATQTLGIANIDIPALMYALFGVEATKSEAENFASYIYKRFGARPAFQEMSGLQGPKAEFFSAIYMFMRQWAYQYNADIPLTFMPELWPGMLIQIPAYDFQAYCTTVTHSFRFGEGGGFSTTVNIAAPARMPRGKKDRDNVLVGLPLAGGYKPGHGEKIRRPDDVEFTDIPKPLERWRDSL